MWDAGRSQGNQGGHEGPTLRKGRLRRGLSGPGKPGERSKCDLLLRSLAFCHETQVLEAKCVLSTFDCDLLSTRPTFRETYFFRGIRNWYVRPTFNETYFLGTSSLRVQCSVVATHGPPDPDVDNARVPLQIVNQLSAGAVRDRRTPLEALPVAAPPEVELALCPTPQSARNVECHPQSARVLRRCSTAWLQGGWSPVSPPTPMSGPGCARESSTHRTCASGGGGIAAILHCCATFYTVHCHGLITLARFTCLYFLCEVTWQQNFGCAMLGAPLGHLVKTWTGSLLARSMEG